LNQVLGITNHILNREYYRTRRKSWR